MIEVRHVTKKYGKKQNAFVALNDISFKVPSGASVAIIGKSGSGKSTLMHVMSGLDRPENGEVIIDEEDILKLKSKAVDKFRATKMSFIFQSFFVQGNETCYDNVSLPLEIAGVPKRTRKQKVLKALEAVELGEKLKSRARDLSGGQKQRLAIARAIVNAPQVLFADEPTGNLDSTTGDVIEKLLFDYTKKQGATLIIVTHDHDLASKCDMQIYIKDGEITNINGGHAKRTESKKISVSGGKKVKK
ncbi:MAG: ABC transporter ATP-binding protein [Candidatus Nomurabacteria bacterium]|nr:MAG: ABC transporter ATP-binding protein [Candidatus Nomurabacteria bacterium]